MNGSIGVAVGRSGPEVFGADVLDEILELVDDLVGVLGVVDRRILTDSVEQFVVGEQRRLAAHREGDRVGRAGWR